MKPPIKRIPSPLKFCLSLFLSLKNDRTLCPRFLRPDTHHSCGNIPTIEEPTIILTGHYLWMTTLIVNVPPRVQHPLEPELSLQENILEDLAGETITGETGLRALRHDETIPPSWLEGKSVFF